MIPSTKQELNSLIPAPSEEKNRKTWFTYFGAVNILKQWIMQNTSKVEKFNLSGALLFGLINDAKDLLMHHLLLTAGHHIYTCKQRDTRPNDQLYIEIVRRSVEIERQIAKDHNSLHTFKKKWS